MSVGVEGDYDRVTLREIAEQQLSTRMERAAGVASVTVSGGLRRQIHVNLSKEKITALNLSVARIVSLLQSENQNIPLGRVNQGDTTYLLRSQGQFQSLDDIGNLVLMTTGGVPVYLKDVADVTDSTEDVRVAAAHQRPARRPHADPEAVRHEHGRGGQRRSGRRSSGSTARCRASS